MILLVLYCFLAHTIDYLANQRGTYVRVSIRMKDSSSLQVDSMKESSSQSSYAVTTSSVDPFMPISLSMPEDEDLTSQSTYYQYLASMAIIVISALLLLCVEARRDPVGTSANKHERVSKKQLRTPKGPLNVGRSQVVGSVAQDRITERLTSQQQHFESTSLQQQHSAQAREIRSERNVATSAKTSEYGSFSYEVAVAGSFASDNSLDSSWKSSLPCDELRSEPMAAAGRQLDDMKEQYNALKLSACQSSTENAELKASVEDLKVQIGHYEDSCAQHQYTRQQLDKFVEKLRQQQELNSRLLLQLSDRESAMSFLESSLSDEKEKTMLGQDEHQRDSQQISEQVFELQGLMERQARLYCEKESTLQLLNGELQREVVISRTQLQELTAEIEGREDAVRRNELIMDDLTHQLAELMKGSQLVQADNAEYQQKCSALQHEIDQHMRDRDELSTQLKSSEDSLEELRNEFREYKQSKEAEQLQLIVKLNADADAAMKGATLQLVNEKEQLTIEKDLIIDDLTHQLAELMKGSQLVQADNAEYQQKCSALQHEIDQHMRDRDELSTQLKSSEDSLEELRNEFCEYKQSKEAEQLQLMSRWKERDDTMAVLEKEKLDALIALEETEQAIVDLQKERDQLQSSTVSILADSTALSEDLRVARQETLDQALVASSETAALRAEIASLQNSLTKAKLKIIELLRSKTSSPSQ